MKVNLMRLSGIGLGPRDARFHTLNLKITHSFKWKCAIFSDDVSFVSH